MTAIETGSLSAAAEKLGYTPSGVSRMIAALETEHGFFLLLRGKDGVTPTPACEQILPVIRELLFNGNKLEQLSARIRNLDIGTLTIGTAYSSYYHWLAKVTSVFHDQYPGIKIKIINGYSSDLLQQMKEHTVDAAIISQREGDHSWIPLREDRMLAMVPMQHPLASLPAFPVTAFATEPYIDTFPGLDIDNARVFQTHHVKPNTQFSTMDIYATCSMVEAGLGISMDNEINSQQWKEKIKLLPLAPPHTVTIGFAFAEHLPPAAQTFMKFIRSYLSDCTIPNLTLQ